MAEVSIRFYEELNNFLPLKFQKGKTEKTYAFTNLCAVKDIIEAFGIPHTEVDLIIVNGESVNFSSKVKHGDRISVYPRFETIDITNITKLRNRPLRETTFILDVHLGKLAGYLRMLGFDTLYKNSFGDTEIMDIARKENRIILTRDKGILKNSKVTHGYFIRSQKPKEQLKEIIKRFDLKNSFAPFKRCMKCNGLVFPVNKADIYDRLPHKTAKYFNTFFQCDQCRQIYWKGTHFYNMLDFINSLC